MHQLFATQVYQAKLKTDLNDLKNEIFQIQAADKKGQKWSATNYVNGYTSYGSWDQLHQMSSTFANLEKKIDTHVYKFTHSLDYNIKKGDLKLDSIWINIMPAGALHTAHIHPQSVISGTYYVETPPRSGAIKFEDPRMGFFMNSPTIKTGHQKINSRFFALQPVAGDIVLFESWLRHEVSLNRSKKPRLSISFNYGWS